MSDAPRGWAKTTIGAIAELINGRAFKTSEWTTDGLPIVRIQNLNRPDASFNHYSGPVAEKHLVRDGDLLFAWSGTPGTSFGAHIWSGPDAVLNQHIFNVRVSPGHVDREFLRFVINQTLDEQIAKAHGGAGLRHVTKSAFEATEISLPPLREQRRIVDRLKLSEERMQSALWHLERAVQSAEIGRSKTLQSAYDLSLLADSGACKRIKFVSVMDIADALTYGSSAKSYKEGIIPVLRMSNIQDGELDWSSLLYTSDKREIERYSLGDGDVLFNRTNSPQLVGKTAVYHSERPAIFAGYLIRIRCSDRVLPDFLAHCLNSPAGRAYCQAVKSDGISQSNINAKKLGAFKLPCPTMDEQRVIVRKVQAALGKLQSAADQASKAKNHVRVLHKHFVDQALSGRLPTGSDDDEPAAILVDELVAAKERGKREDGERIATGVAVMAKSVEEILRGEGDWISAQDVAQQYGIGFGSKTEAVEPFYAELRSLAALGRLAWEPIRDAAGVKVGDRMRLKD